MESKFYSLQNDYMFHAVLQESEEVLRELVSALVGRDPDSIYSCTVENPIILGEHIDEKTAVLDTKLLLNDAERVYNDHFCIRTVDLTQIDRYRAGEEELASWARLFKASSWEELEYLAKEKEVYQKMILTMKRLTAEERVQMELEAREDYERERIYWHREGQLEGRQEGRQEGQLEINRLYDRLINNGRIEDMKRAVREPAYLQSLLEEFKIS